MALNNFTIKELDQIRDIAIKLYTSENPGATKQDALRLRVIAEATYQFLKRKGLINEPSAPTSDSSK